MERHNRFRQGGRIHHNHDDNNKNNNKGSLLLGRPRMDHRLSSIEGQFEDVDDNEEEGGEDKEGGEGGGEEGDNDEEVEKIIAGELESSRQSRKHPLDTSQQNDPPFLSTMANRGNDHTSMSDDNLLLPGYDSVASHHNVIETPLLFRGGPPSFPQATSQTINEAVPLSQTTEDKNYPFRPSGVSADSHLGGTDDSTLALSNDYYLMMNPVPAVTRKHNTMDTVTIVSNSTQSSHSQSSTRRETVETTTAASLSYTRDAATRDAGSIFPSSLGFHGATAGAAAAASAPQASLMNPWNVNIQGSFYGISNPVAPPRVSMVSETAQFLAPTGPALLNPGNLFQPDQDVHMSEASPNSQSAMASSTTQFLGNEWSSHANVPTTILTCDATQISKRSLLSASSFSFQSSGTGRTPQDGIAQVDSPTTPGTVSNTLGGQNTVGINPTSTATTYVAGCLPRNKLSHAPKSLLYALYGKDPYRKILGPADYITWSDDGPSHNLRFTCVFVCPQTGELFASGQYGPEDKPIYEFKNGLYWFATKKLAEHAAAARAHDCLEYRRVPAGRPFPYVGNEEPYHPGTGGGSILISSKLVHALEWERISEARARAPDYQPSMESDEELEHKLFS